MLVISGYAVTACETGHYILVVFVVMSKEEGICIVERLHISMILGRMSISSSSVETFQHWQKPKNEAIYNNAGLITSHLTSFSSTLLDSASGD